MISSNSSDVASNTLDRFDDLDDRFENELEQTINEAQSRASQNVPVDEGKLRNDISIDRGDRWAKVFNTLDYARRINWGFAGTDSLGRTYDQEGTYYMEDAALTAFKNSIDRLEA